MTDAPMISLPLLKLGRFQLDPGLRALQPGQAGADPVVTATVPVPASPPEPQTGWDLAWRDAATQAERLGADKPSAQALPSGAGNAFGGSQRVVVASHGEVLLSRWLTPDPAASAVRVGPLPHLLEVAADAARRPPYVVLLAGRAGSDVLVHSLGDQEPAQHLDLGDRPGLQPDADPTRPPQQIHGERHITDREPESGGERNAEYIAGRVARAAASVGAHIVLGGGDDHILDAVESHLAPSLTPVIRLAGVDNRDNLDVVCDAALDEITAEAVRAVSDQVAAQAHGQAPAAVRGIEAVAEQLAERQVAVLLVAADIAADGGGDGHASYRIGPDPTEFLVGETEIGIDVPLDDGLVWAALHQDAIVLELADRSGPLAGEPVAALLRRGTAA